MVSEAIVVITRIIGQQTFFRAEKDFLRNEVHLIAGDNAVASAVLWPGPLQPRLMEPDGAPDDGTGHRPSLEHAGGEACEPIGVWPAN